MRLQILHVPGCPNVAVLRERLNETFGDGTDVVVRVINNLAEAAAAGMAGSPTLLVDGVDPFARPGQAPSMSCRLYRDADGRVARAPTVEQLRQVLTGGNSQCCETSGSLRNSRARAAPADPAERAVHRAILRAFAVNGTAPGPAALEQAAAPFGQPVIDILARLHDHDVIRLGPDGTLRAAYPFSPIPTRHRVQLSDGPRVDAMCVIDALGIPPMLNTDAVITTTAPNDEQPITVTFTDGNVVWEPPTAVVFVSAQAGAGPSVDTCCDYLNAFPTRAAAEAWAAAHPDNPGEIIGGIDAEHLGRTIFGDLLCLTFESC
jgi:hypothetical protein